MNLEELDFLEELLKSFENLNTDLKEIFDSVKNCENIENIEKAFMFSLKLQYLNKTRDLKGFILNQKQSQEIQKES